jgi:Protein of unknown function (DUF1579)
MEGGPMNRFFAVICFSLFLLFPVVAQEKTKGNTHKTPTPEEMAATMRKYGQPGAHHKVFNKYVGKWTHKTRVWMDPSQPPMTSEGTCEYRLTMEGRYLMCDFVGSFMGQPFNGMSLTGYDNFREEYKGVWVDNAGTAVLTMTGQLDKEGKTLTMTGTMDEPATGERDKKFKMTDHFVDENTLVSEMYDTIPGKGLVRVMEITYSRVK